MRTRFVVLTAVVASAFVFRIAAQESPHAFRKPLPVADSVTTDAGIVQGLPSNASGIRIFKGVAYAAPPIGDRRWRAPERLEPWEGVKRATEFSADCVQPAPAGGHRMGAGVSPTRGSCAGTG